MAETKLPDSTLEELRCHCGRYLSSAPISVRQDGQSVCSSCVDGQAPHLGAVTQNFAYEALAKLFKFPCYYQPYGCPRYVEFNKAAEHEDECLYRAYECPVNLLSSCSKKGTNVELCQHYEQDHPELYLKYSNFPIEVTTDFEVHRLFKIDDVVFLLQIKCLTTLGKVWFNTIYFGNVTNASLISYNIKLSSNDDKKRVMELEEQKACSVNNVLMLPSQFVEVDISIAMSFLNNSKLQCHWMLNIPEELKDKIKNQQKLEREEIFESKKKSIRCPNCGIYMVPPIYRCDKNHITCVDCKGYDNQCLGCFKDDVKFTTPTDLEIISKSGVHNCKWHHCNESFSYDKVRSHEQECVYRVYKCPECTNWSGIYDLFLNHFKCTHPDLNIHMTNVVALRLQNYTSYVVVHREVFKFVVYRPLPFGVENHVKVYFLGLPSYADYWKYEVKDNSENVYNFCGDQYKGTVTIKDFTESNGWTFGNVTVDSGKCYGLYITKKEVQ